MTRGYKEFALGELVESATGSQADMNDIWSKQVVMYFADAAGRDAAVTAPEEGMHAYLADSNKVTVYDGAAWEESGGLILTTKGDLLVHNGSGLQRLPKGTDTHLLTADSTQAAGVKWAPTPSGNHIEAKVTAGAAASESVTWTSAFGTTPVVVATPETTSSIGVKVTSRSTTGATVETFNTGTGSGSPTAKLVIAREAT